MEALKKDPKSVKVGGTSSPGSMDHVQFLIAAKAAGIIDLDKIVYIAFQEGQQLAALLGGDVYKRQGTNAQVDIFLDIIEKISRQRNYHFKIAAIYSEIDKNLIKEKLKNGQIAPCGPVPPLSDEEIDLATTVVAQMGAVSYTHLIYRSNLEVIIPLS